MQSIACRIGKHNRIVVAVSEEIVALQAAVGAEDGIRAEEPANVGVVVSGVEVVPARFHVIVVPTIAERVHGSDGGGQAARHGQHFPPCVVRIAYHFHAVRVHNPQYVALYILMVPVLHAVVLHSYDRPICVVHIVDRMRVCSRPPLRQYLCSVGRVRHNVRRSVRDMLDILLRGADAVCIILHPQRLVRAACRGVGQRNFRQSVSRPVQIRCVFPVFRVSRSVISDRRAIVIGQQIAPCAVRVTVGFAGFEFA